MHGRGSTKPKAIGIPQEALWSRPKHPAGEQLRDIPRILQQRRDLQLSWSKESKNIHGKAAIRLVRNPAKLERDHWDLTRPNHC